MDICKKSDSRQFNLKRFTMTAIASAVFALNTNVARAISCPPQIIGTSLAGIVCDFDTGSSITVENGGTVGGISMISYSPSPSSFITIDAGGTVSNATGVAISILNSQLSNGLSNNGTIQSTNGSGIVVASSSTINGGLSNSGLISTGSIGISVNQSTINDGIINSGVINSTNGTGILISNSSTINGGISNSGTINAGNVFVGITINNNSVIDNGINNSGLINVSSGNGILVRSSSVINGGISNSGTINSVNNMGLEILNLSTIQGNIFNSGTINGGNRGISIHNASTLNGSLINTGTISGNTGISVFSATTISGGISNSGTITGGNGISVTSSAVISGGISNSGVIQGDSQAIFIDSSSDVSDINIIGQNARIIGAVDAVNTAVNITSGAVFTSEGTYNVDSFNIASNALFNMRNTITANSVTNGGTLAVGNTSQTIVGDYTQNVGGVFQIGVTNGANYGQLVVSNTVDLSQSGNINVQVAANATLHAGEILSNVISGSTLITPTEDFAITDNSFVWEFTANANNTGGVNLTANMNPLVYNTCQGDYCQGSANTIINQIAAGNSAFSPYASLPTQTDFETAASQATPELTNENIQVTQLITKSVMDIVPMWSILQGKSAGDAMLYQAGKVWFKPYGGTMTQNESDSVQGFNATIYGMVIGKDIQPTEDWLLGGALALGKDNMRGKSVLDGQTIYSDDYQGIVYAAKKLPHNLYFASQGLIGYGDNNTKRSIPLYSSTAESEYNSWFTNVRAQLGWNVYELNHGVVLTPEIDASYLFIKQGSYQETGSTMDLSVDSSNNSSFVFGAYGHGAFHLTTFSNKDDFTLTAYAGVARDMLNSQPQTTATFVAGGPSFTTFGVPLNSTVFRSGVGLTFANPIKPLKVDLNYDIQTGNNTYNGVGSITLAYQI